MRQKDKALDLLASVSTSQPEEQPAANTLSAGMNFPRPEKSVPSVWTYDEALNWLQNDQPEHDEPDTEESPVVSPASVDRYTPPRNRPPWTPSRKSTRPGSHDLNSPYLASQRSDNANAHEQNSNTNPKFPGSENTVQKSVCIRQAFKAPQPFQGGLNNFSHVLDQAEYPPLWFTASQDAYKFYLGNTTQHFYLIEMSPNDLATDYTSRVEWTVIGKPWAHPKALQTMGWPYHEDSIGYMWIEKELSPVSHFLG